jgi:uncharacterized protein (UPF0335 family)
MARTATRTATIPGYPSRERDGSPLPAPKPARDIAIIPPRSGHNSQRERLHGMVRRIEAIEAQIAGLNSDKSEVFKAAKAAGIDPAGLRGALRYRRDPAAAEARDEATRTVLAQLDGLAGVDAQPSRAHAHVHAREAEPGDGDGE